jgi:hypothetical protein
VVLDYVLIKSFGFVGAAWSSLLSMVVVLMDQLWFLRQRFGLWPYDGHTVLAWLIIGIIAALIGFLPHLGPPFMDALWRCALITVLFWPAVHWLRITPELVHQFYKITRRVVPGAARKG